MGARAMLAPSFPNPRARCALQADRDCGRDRNRDCDRDRVPQLPLSQTRGLDAHLARRLSVAATAAGIRPVADSFDQWSTHSTILFGRGAAARGLARGPGRANRQQLPIVHNQCLGCVPPHAPRRAADCARARAEGRWHSAGRYSKASNLRASQWPCDFLQPQLHHNPASCACDHASRHQRGGGEQPHHRPLHMRAVFKPA